MLARSFNFKNFGKKLRLTTKSANIPHLSHFCLTKMERWVGDIAAFATKKHL
jgi:hypothetical protein